ncbi:MAG: type III pantothenate kinase [Bacteroidetes bacterium]|uniref:Type III pantothenate kinase n=1 Tax=Candidatus Cryptobacteroides faecavium TaxID=2840762 RepID=A0A9D9IE90_9BACT|nr:type III pantothenate kinase [Candidatus Cryptobacteroides faecavium]
MPNLIIDIGNTALKAAWSDGMTLGKTFRYQGEKITEFISGLVSRDIPDVMVISTVRDIPKGSEEAFRHRCGKLVVMDRNRTEEVLSHGLPPYLSPDRAASVIAARYLFRGKGCTVMDFGTVMAVDFLDTDGRYSGGNISPGCRTRFKAVSRYSRNIPLYDTPVTIQEKGTSLESSVESGIITGMQYEIQGYIDRFPENIVVFTGGDANYFAKRMKNSIFVVCNQVLMGLALIADGYVKDIH